MFQRGRTICFPGEMFDEEVAGWRSDKKKKKNGRAGRFLDKSFWRGQEGKNMYFDGDFTERRSTKHLSELNVGERRNSKCLK